MKSAAHNTFNQGMVMDLTPLTTPNNVLTDCLNGTIITYTGNEFTLQNDMGNCKVDTAKLPPGFLPVGMTEYAGIIYVAAYNPETGEEQIGSFPSPQRDFSTSDYNNIGPVNFKTNMFTVNTGTDVKENLSVVRKLFEPEIFQLHPGDKFLVQYDINPPAGGDPSFPDTINTELKFENYISKDVANRKLFRLKFYKISDSNNLVEMDESTINVVPSTSDIENEYGYFKEPSSATLAISLELETLDLFQVSVVDASLKTNANKKVAIEAIGQSASLADFQGVRVDVTQPGPLTSYLDKGNNITKKVSGLIDGLAANDDFECTITPYSKYFLFPRLQQKFKFTLGKYLTAGSGVNNLFRYFIDPSFVKIDFDYTFQGNSINGPHLYIEFYDPWSDYSIIKRVDNPTFYGINSVIIETIDEPRVDVFNSTTQGGTPVNKLITNPDTQYEKTLLNSTNLIRTDQFLRKNHFYIVRISGVDSDISSGTPVYTHYDLYKGLFTNDMFNATYQAQNGLTPTDPLYVSDFNQLDFDISTIGYQTTSTQTSNNISVPVSTSTPPELMTNGQYYMVNAVKNTSFTNYKNTKTYTTETDYSVALALQGVDRVFGTFKESLLSVTLPDLEDSNSPTGSKPTVTDLNYDNNTNIAPNSVASWTITAASGSIYNVTTKLITTRNIWAPVAYDDSKLGTSYKEVPLINSFLHRPNGDGSLINSSAGMEFTRGGDTDGTSTVKHYLDNTSGTIVTDHTTYPPYGQNIFQVINPLTKKYSGIWAGFRDGNPSRWYADGAPGVYGQFFDSDATWRMNVLLLNNPANAEFGACRTNDIQAAKDFFNTVKVASNVKKNLWLHYADGSAIQKNGDIITTAKFTNAPLITNFTPDFVSGLYVKTYLSTFRFKANNDIEEFNPTNINNYIASRKGSSVIVDGKDTIRDGFIPYISTPSTSTYNLAFNDIVIDQAPDADVLQSIRTAFTIGQQDPVYTVSGTYKAHGTLFSSIPEQYSNFLTKFAVGNMSDGVEVDENTVYIHLTNGSEPSYKGWYGRGGKPRANEAPRLYLDFSITKL